jgi:hypothetical protein
MVQQCKDAVQKKKEKEKELNKEEYRSKVKERAEC